MLLHLGIVIMNDLEIVKKAKAQISDPQHWCKFVCARDGSGNSVGIVNNNAVSWCIVGALIKITFDSDVTPLHKMNAYCHKKHNIGLGEFNDLHTHEEVLALFDEFIASFG